MLLSKLYTVPAIMLNILLAYQKPNSAYENTNTKFNLKHQSQLKSVNCESQEINLLSNPICLNGSECCNSQDINLKMNWHFFYFRKSRTSAD